MERIKDVRPFIPIRTNTKHIWKILNPLQQNHRPYKAGKDVAIHIDSSSTTTTSAYERPHMHDHCEYDMPLSSKRVTSCKYVVSSDIMCITTPSGLIILVVVDKGTVSKKQF